MSSTMATSKSQEDKNIAVEAYNVPNTNSAHKSEPVAEVDEAYMSASWFTKFYRGVLFQMILFGA